MLALQQHFSVCASCDTEMHSLREVKRLLRALHETRPRTDMSDAIARRLADAEAPTALWPILFPEAPRPQRGRRLLTSLALSCFTVLVFAGPFAPASQNEALSSASFVVPQRYALRTPLSIEGGMLTGMPGANMRPSEFLTLTDTEEPRRERLFVAQQADLAGAPLGDEAVRGYVQGDVALAGYRTR